MANSINYSEYFNDLNMGLLTIDGRKYKFAMNDLKEIRSIFNGRNPVKEYRHKTIQKNVAIKSINLPLYLENEEQDIKKIRREVEVHQNLKNPKYVVQLYGFSIIKNKLRICIELMDESLYDFYKKVHKKFDTFPEDFIGVIGVCILNALIYCKIVNI